MNLLMRAARRSPLAIAVLAIAAATVMTIPAAAEPTAGTRPAAAQPAAPSMCRGLAKRPGVTKKHLTLANVADISGPVPGLFKPAQLGVKAYVAYFNSRSKLCGRSLRLRALDSRTDAGASLDAYRIACRRAFAAVGSMGAFDNGGAGATQGCGLPDLRVSAVTAKRFDCQTCFGARVREPGVYPNILADFFARRNPAAVKKAAILHLGVPSASEQAATAAYAARRRGFTLLYTAQIDVAEFNYGPYVAQLKSKGVEFVQFIGTPATAARLATAMSDAGFAPKVFFASSELYRTSFTHDAGAAAAGAFTALDFTPFEEAAKNAEFRRYRHWLRKVAPGAKPDAHGLYAWSAARLFVKAARGVEGRLTRPSLLRELRTVRGWSDLGAHAAQAVGPKQAGGCFRFVRWAGGSWKPVGRNGFLCGGRTVKPAG